jgi:hypothetical protein
MSASIAALTAQLGAANTAAAELSVKTAIDVINAKADGDAKKNIR